MKNYKSLIDALDDLRNRGYAADFATDSVCLYCGDLDIRLAPEYFHIDEVHCFEAGSSPDDNSVIYAISSITGIKGTLIDAYGPCSATMSFEMAKKLQTDRLLSYNNT